MARAPALPPAKRACPPGNPFWYCGYGPRRLRVRGAAAGKRKVSVLLLEPQRSAVGGSAASAAMFSAVGSPSADLNGWIRSLPAEGFGRYTKTEWHDWAREQLLAGGGRLWHYWVARGDHEQMQAAAKAMPRPRPRRRPHRAALPGLRHVAVACRMSSVSANASGCAVSGLCGFAVSQQRALGVG